MQPTPTSAALLAAAAGVLLSLFAAYVPGFSTWFNSLPGPQKRVTMIGLLLICTLASIGLSCADGAGLAELLRLPAADCSEAGIIQLAISFFSALATNQATYTLAVRK